MIRREVDWIPVTVVDMPDLKDRFRGLMVGIAVGDALGRPVEGHPRVSGSYLEEIRVHPLSLVYSDDAAMSIWLAESLLACDGFDGDDMAHRFADGYYREPYRGYGANIVDAFTRVAEGMDWREAAAMQFEGSGSYGNGGAMRVAPVALWAYPDLGETVRLARETARVTHTHPLGVEGAVIQAAAAQHALGEGFDPQQLLDTLQGLVETVEFQEKLEILPEALQRDDDEYARLQLGNWVSAHNSVVTALYCFIQAESFEDAVVRAIRLGGDTDTIAAMAGALTGARHGLTSIPEIWNAVEGEGRLIELADSFLDRLGR